MTNKITIDEKITKLLALNNTEVMMFLGFYCWLNDNIDELTKKLIEYGASELMTMPKDELKRLIQRQAKAIDIINRLYRLYFG